MDFSKIRLVVSDMDGTLLNEKSEVSLRFFNQFKELKKRDIHFVAASGRQYHSIVEKLETIKDDISIIAENGGMMKHDNVEQVLLQLTEKDIQKCVKILREIDDAFIVLCGKKSAYIETSDPEFISNFKNYYSEYQIVENLTKVRNDDFLKIAVYHSESSENNVLPQISALTQTLKVTVSGQNWLDISHPEANKGYALKILQNRLGITREETMVFGDYNNDVEMLDLAYFSYAMENAHIQVKKTARFQAKSNAEEGVETILDLLLLDTKP